jgi:hypothetical protein
MSFQVDKANIAGRTQLYFENTSSGFDATDLSTYTFSSVNFGDPAASRYVIVAIFCRTTNGDPSLTSVTIGGVTATLAAKISQYESGSIFDMTAIYYANVPSGRTGDIVATFSNSQIRCAYAAGTSKKGIVLHDTLTDVDAGTAGVTVGGGIDLFHGGLIVAASETADNGPSASWSGATEVVYGDIAGEYMSYSMAYVQNGTYELNKTVQCTWGTPTLNTTFVAASFK